MSWIVITTSSDCESCFTSAASGRLRRVPIHAHGCVASAPTWNCWHGFTTIIVLILTTTDTDSLSSRLSSYASTILIASGTVFWLRPFLDEDPFGLFAATVLPCEVLASSRLCSFTSCRSALLLLQLGLLFCGSHRPPVSSTSSSSFVSSLLLATLPCELFHAFSSARSSRAVSQHGTFTCCAWRSLAPELGCSGSHVHVAILLWPALAGGLSVGVTVAPEFVCLWFLAFTTSSFPGKRTVKVNDRASHVPLRFPGRPPPPRPCCCDSSQLSPLCSFKPLALCVDEDVLDFVRGPVDETSRPQPFVISSFLDALSQRRHHLKHLVICLRLQACDELPRNGECV